MILLVPIFCGCGYPLILQAWHDGQVDRVRYLTTEGRTEATDHCPHCGVRLTLDVIRDGRCQRD